MSTDKHRGVALRTRLQHAGRDTRVEGGSPVNPPIVRASTILFDSVAELEDVRARRSTERLLSYGARGNPTAFALEDLISELEGGYRTRLFPTGLAAITQALIAYLKPGDHVLITDAVYGPVRNFALRFFERYGIRYSFFAADGSDIAQRYLPETRLVYVESPGSLAYEIVDLPALVQGAHAHGALVAADNTWGAGGYLYQPLRHGADIVISAATKYLSGHSDVVMGAVTTREAVWQTFNLSADAHGMTVSPDDAWLVLRGARTLASRLSVHAATALELSRWLAEHEAVAYVLHPALPEDPGHALWKRDFSGSNGLLSFALKDQRPGRAEAVVDNLRLFGIGASWGGFESLVMVAELSNVRSVSDWRGRGTIIRLHAGLEAPGDLIADLEQALSVLPNAY
ncbi:cystathionine beta-lyase [Uliginosibacterium gangwonense]|uniref:cystathionine beta-lyase n=1 Tax=Uliginosibacterium gangwonense TaxID=392736 RepID=UPI00047830EC|nr:cystathionine beta-lyase [Uliginosibacterium gangwonense]